MQLDPDLLRHLAGDWGDIDGSDERDNVLSLEEGDLDDELRTQAGASRLDLRGTGPAPKRPVR